MDDSQETFRLAYEARASINMLDEATINELLEAIACETEQRIHYILFENEKDLQRMEKDNPKYDRLMLTEERIMGIVSDIRNIINIPSPIGKVIDKREHANGMKIRRELVPFGVIGVIYEARPNVNFDVFSLCLKTKNVCLLKGGSDARFSNEAIVGLIRDVLDSHNINPNICSLLPNDREATDEMLKARRYVDLIIPRGGKKLIDYVRTNSSIPIIETGAGVCHTYFHKSGDKDIARNIITNAKTRRVSVCNSLDCLVIDKSRLTDLPFVCEKLADESVVIYADKLSYEALEGSYPKQLLKQSDAETFGTEFLDYKMGIKTVLNMDEALEHIEKYSSKHSEAIVCEDETASQLFKLMTDAACVYVNVSTAFTDGAQLGLGAEIGISTQKMHARGPMGLDEICTYKWIIEGNGQTRH